MNNRYTLPIAVSLAVHATLLFAFDHPPAAGKPGKPVTRAQVEPTMRITDPERDVPADDNEPPAKGAPEVDRPAQEDIPRPLKPLDIPIESASPAPRSDRRDWKMDCMPGNPEGIEGGLKWDGKIVSASGLDNAPNARVQLSPDYPFAAKQEGLEGEVVVEFLVEESGRVSNPRVVRSSNPVFDEPSLRAVLKWHFEPGKRDGRVVRFRMAVPLVFSLDKV